MEQVTYERAEGYGSLLETVDTPVIELSFLYGGQRIYACDERDRFFAAAAGGTAVVMRDRLAENAARAALESFGAVELECLEDVATPPSSRAHYLLRPDGDVHDFCGFSAYAVPQLEAAGWTIEVDEAYPYRVVEAREPRWYARIEEGEKPDWFSLELGLELEGRRVNLLPALVDLLDRSSATSLSRLVETRRTVALPLPDGRYLTIPPEPVRAILRVISELYSGEGPDADTLAFHELMAGALSRLDDALELGGGRPIRWLGGETIRARGDQLSRAKTDVEPPPELRATLRSYQREGVAWLQHLRECDVGGVLADDMGLGKTLQTIAHIAIEKAHGRLTSPALVISPTSLCPGWAREIGKFAPHLKVIVLQGASRHGRYKEIEGADVVVTSYPILVRDQDELAARAWHLLILDEAHVIKNTRSRSHQAAKRLDAAHRVCLTGTPIENHLGELWALFDFLNPGLLGDELSFRRWYRIPVEQMGDEDRLAALREAVAPYLLRRLKREVATELPPKTELARPVTLGGEQAALYEAIRVAAHGDVRRLIAKKGLAASTVPILDALTKLRQVCCDPRLVPMRAARDVKKSAKYSLLFELLEAQLGRGHRVLVFSQFTRMLALIARGLEKRNLRYLVLTGESKDRQKLVDAFEAGQADVFLISLKAGGVGLTLTSADSVIHYDPWWNPAAQDQATDRAYRIGQTKPVVATSLFVQGSVEERMLALQAKKRRLAEGILGGGAGRLALSEDDVEELFAPLS
ncbi:MAG: DEAD/DEAH box helicase [Sandaracinaceae bacterium]